MVIQILANAQSHYRVGSMPQINFNKKFDKGWKTNVKLESRQLFTEGEFGQGAEGNYQYTRTDIALLAARKFPLGHTLAGGYMMRIKGQKLIHRLVQQYAWVIPFPSFRLDALLKGSPRNSFWLVVGWFVSL